MSWQIKIERKAQKTLKKVPDPYKTNIVETIRGLKEDPHPHGCKKLSGQSDYWRVRVGTYRIIYQIKDEELLILIIRIGSRGDIYQGL